MSSHSRNIHGRVITVIAMAVILTAFLLCSVSSTAMAWGTDGPLDYIIIYHESLAGPTFDQLLALKVAQGSSYQSYPVPDGTSARAIRRLIRSVYHSSDYAPLYLLLVGSAKRNESGNDSIADTSVHNLIPAYYRDDCFGHRTAYDQWYAYMSESDQSWKRPRMMVGRIPARNTSELQNYVDKLVSHDADTADSQWKHRVFLIAGDKDRGAFPDFPSPTMVNNGINSLYDTLPASMSGTIMRYSDYEADSLRHQAFVNAVDTGQGIVMALTTGSNAGNLGWIISRPGFDAGMDLSNVGQYPVFFAASCNLAQFDIDLFSEQSLPENLLLAPSRGVIGIVGPTGASSDFSNIYYLKELANRLFNRGITRIGNLNVAAGLTLKQPPHYGVGDTYNMTSVLGDPGLQIPSRQNGLNDVVIDANMELTEAVPFQNREYDVGAGLENTKAGVVKRGHLYGLRSYRIEGYDNGNPDPVGYWTLYDNLGLVIDSTRRFLTYQIKALEHPEGVGRFGVQCIVDGALLGLNIRDQFGIPIALSWRDRDTPIGQCKFFAFDLHSQYGKTLDMILVGYTASDYTISGDFAAVFDNIKLAPTWGFPPVVGAIQMPSQVLEGSTTNVSLSAEDQDDFMFGDQLSVAWSVNYGSITGEGLEVVYHAPNQVGYDKTLTANVSDKGGHTVTRTKTFDVVAELPACPHLFVWDGVKYVDEGAVLTRSQVRDTVSAVCDPIPLFTKPALTRDGAVRFVLRENGHDKTSLDKAAVTWVRLESDPAEPVGITSEGKVLKMLDPIPPVQCRFYNGVYRAEDFGEGGDGPPGYDQLDKVCAADGMVFRAYGPGYLTLWYRGKDLLAGALPKPNESGAEEGGGPGLPPPGKNMDKIAMPSSDTTVPNYVSVNVWLPREGWKQVEVARVAPQSTFRLPQLVDLLPYVDSEYGLAVRISWTWNFSADDLSFYRFSNSGITEKATSLRSVVHSTTGDVTTAILHDDGAQATLVPGQEITLEFGSPTENYDLAVLKLWGKYEPAPIRGVDLTAPGSVNDSDEPLLRQNVPNPFNTRTRIMFTLPREGRARLVVYNILGQVVREITDENLGAGDYEYVWEGNNRHGRPVPSGIYFYTLVFENLTFSKKMIMLK